MYLCIKNAVLREAYPKDIIFFYTNTERYLATGTQSVGKRSGVLPYGHASQGQSPATNKNKKVKIFRIYWNNYFI